MTTIQITEKNFDSGFKGKYKGYHIDNRLIKELKIKSPIFQKLRTYKVSRIININIMGFELFDSIVYLNEQIENIYMNHGQTETIENLCKINIEKENLIHLIKRIIDDLIMLSCIHYDSNKTFEEMKISIGSIGALKGNNSDLGKLIKKDLIYSKYEYLFEIINELHNAYKHSWFMKDAHQEISRECVSLTAYYAKRNKFDKIDYHNHNLMHIIISFSDFLLEYCNIETSNKKIEINKQTRTLYI